MMATDNSTDKQNLQNDNHSLDNTLTSENQSQPEETANAHSHDAKLEETAQTDNIEPTEIVAQTETIATELLKTEDLSPSEDIETSVEKMATEIINAEAEEKIDTNLSIVKDPILQDSQLSKHLQCTGIAHLILITLTILTGIGTAGVVVATVLAGWSVNAILLSIFGCLAVILIEFILLYYAVFSPLKIYKPKLVLPFLEKRLNVTNYEWNPTRLAKADIKDARIANNQWMLAQASDRFHAEYRGCSFGFYDLILSHQLYTKIPVFMGQLYILTLRQAVKCPIRITEYSLKEKSDPNLRTTSFIKTGCVEFDNRFSVEVLTDEQSKDGNNSPMAPQQAMAYAHDVLTPELAQAFVDADDKADSRTRMYFTGNKLYLTHENEFDPFEYRYLKDKKCSIQTLKDRIKNEIIRIEKILDVFIDSTNDLLQLKPQQTENIDLSDVGFIEDVWNELPVESENDTEAPKADDSNADSNTEAPKADESNADSNTEASKADETKADSDTEASKADEVPKV